MEELTPEGWWYRRNGVRRPAGGRLALPTGAFVVPFAASEDEAVKAFRRAWRRQACRRATRR